MNKQDELKTMRQAFGPSYDPTDPGETSDPRPDDSPIGLMIGFILYLIVAGLLHLVFFAEYMKQGIIKKFSTSKKQPSENIHHKSGMEDRQKKKNYRGA